jgi:hypothetical protein
LAPTAQGLQQLSEQAASGLIHEQSDGTGVAHQPTSTSGAVGASITVGGTLPVSGALPVSAPLQAGGAAGTASGGIGAAAPALALLVVAAVWLLDAFLRGRLALDLFPWKSTLLSLRLERPG